MAKDYLQAREKERKSSDFSHLRSAYDVCYHKHNYWAVTKTLEIRTQNLAQGKYRCVLSIVETIIRE